MLKRILAVAAMVCALPALATAGTAQLKTQVQTPGGYIETSLNAGFKQTSAYGAKFYNYSTPAAVAPTGTITTNPGYTASFTATGDCSLIGASFTCGDAGGEVVGYFTYAPVLAQMTAVAGTGGKVNMTSIPNVYVGQKLLSSVKFVFTPKYGYTIATSGITFNGSATVPANVVVTGGGAIPVTVTFLSGYAVNGNMALGSTFTPTGAGAPASTNGPVNVATGVTTATLTGTPAGGTWSKIGGPSVFDPALNKYVPVPATIDAAGNVAGLGIDGIYYFKYAVNGTYATTQVVVGTVATCQGCHDQNGVGAGIEAKVLASIHGANAVQCANCHLGANTAGHPGAAQCQPCHGSYATPATFVNSCSACHGGDIHNVKADVFAKTECLQCHDVAQHHSADPTRAILPEFQKRSHHITGATPTSAQCKVCHLETLGDLTTHNNGQIDLRNADTNAAIVFSGTEHTAMDNFCFSCHDADGALAAPAIVAGATAANPFADTLTNSYDLVARPGVVDVKTAFQTTNASHHAVSGQRYKFRFSTAENAAAWAARNGQPVPDASKIAYGKTDLNGNPIEFEAGLTYDPAGIEKGGEATLYEGDKFVATYIPLGATANVADDSTLHCGDCHTVGQWKAGSSTSADGSATTAVIGAHGSNNEYLLRNSLGTDALHSGQTYVCFNCHKTEVRVADQALWDEAVAEGLMASSVAPAPGSPENPLGRYVPLAVPTTAAGWGALHPNIFAFQVTGYATAHAVSAFHAQCQSDSSAAIGATDRQALSSAGGHRDRILDSNYTATAASGNITGIACTNCHNSGLRNGWGGIHGGNNTYTDGLGRAQTTYRFMPGMGNYRYAPPGGWDGKDTSDPSLLTVNNPVYPGTPGSRTDSPVGFPGHSGKPMGGCYTNGTSSDLNPGFSTCNHHPTSTATSVKNTANIGADPKNANFRTTYGGGTTGNPTTYEPTIREATSGGTLVTRPLHY